MLAAATAATASLVLPSGRTVKLAAFDMDGTLLNAQHTLSDASVRALRELSDAGIIVSLCTGRSSPAIEAHVERLALPQSLPCVVYNGALVMRCEAGSQSCEPIFTEPLSDDAVTRVLALAEQAGLVAQYYVGDEIYAVCKTDAHRALTRRYATLVGLDDAHTFVDSYDVARARGPPLKLLLMGDEVDETVELLNRGLPDGVAKVVRGSPPFFVEVLHPDVNKGLGLRRMCEACGIEPDECVVFGDGDNDIEYVQAAGLGIAMSNARDVLKAVADRETEFSNDDDGVAIELRRLGLIS